MTTEKTAASAAEKTNRRTWTKSDQGRIAWRWEAFAQAMAEGLSGTDAAKQAGYSPRSAHTQASDLLKRPEIIERIAQLKSRKQAATGYSLADALLEAEEARQMALSKGNAGALIQAVRLKSDLAGLLVQRTLNQTTIKTAEDGIEDLSAAVQNALADPAVRALIQDKATRH